jgi:chromosome segregation ATPase
MAREELETTRAERDTAQAEAATLKSELKSAQTDLERATAEAKANRDAAEKLAEAEQKLVEMGDVERRVAEAHSMLEKMRNDFELEREGYAVTERDLRAKLTSETERNAALTEEQRSLSEERAALQKQVDALESEMEALRAQNSNLADVYATAKRLSEELARGAGDLATTLNKTPGQDRNGSGEVEVQLPSDDGSDGAASSANKAKA